MIGSFNVLTLFPVFIVLGGISPVVHFQSFFLTIKAENTDGSITMIESFPCEAGSSVELCIVEVIPSLRSKSVVCARWASICGRCLISPITQNVRAGMARFFVLVPPRDGHPSQ